ncbi:histidinol dehydrogenase [Shewanella sp. JM162201]|uniref:Histidinol dehydrogenase n=1 Tax=Shewanella jiangmenensis TaxID=2837387 RepID=A0ABS5V7F1_9GAMM|nr:histidinol dehydrogenase [Shewanella jiangmenensis]MBT1445591.1 histidinol dehydrogenase [Shewanella jiangmenensis]
MDTVLWSALSADEQRAVLKRSPMVGDVSLGETVKDILDKVRSRGDVALLDFSARFDKVEVSSLRLDDAEIRAACARVDESLKAAIRDARANIATFHSAQKMADISLETLPGVRCELKSEAIDKVGLYIPGGSAPLISTVLMLAVPAELAGCNQRVLVSPPPIDDAIVYAASLCGISEIFQVGGAQAIAALAYGTDSIPAVDKIFGPGNRFVTEAKAQVARDSRAAVTIDMPAGPSEVLIIADEFANPEFVAADLLSQAEHGSDSQVILVTDSSELAAGVSAALSRQLSALPRKETAETALSSSRIIITDNLTDAAGVSNRYAPEHLIIQTQAPRELLKYIRAAGSVFLGAYTPESVGDYASGTNHVLPTYGYSKSVSSLSLADFSRRFTVQELTAEGLSRLGNTVMPLAGAESLDAHKNAVKIRLDALNAANELNSSKSLDAGDKQ